MSGRNRRTKRITLLRIIGSHGQLRQQPGLRLENKTPLDLELLDLPKDGGILLEREFNSFIDRQRMTT